MVGLTITKVDVDMWAGTITREIDEAMTRTLKFKAWLDGQLDSDLTALGYTVGDIANLRSAFGDAAQLAGLFNGTATLNAAKDFRVFMRRLYGFGAL